MYHNREKPLKNTEWQMYTISTQRIFNDKAFFFPTA